MTNGLVHLFTCYTSTFHTVAAITTQAKPAVSSTYELIQTLLLMGNDQVHMRPVIVASGAPAANTPFRRSGKVNWRWCVKPRSTETTSIVPRGDRKGR